MEENMRGIRNLNLDMPSQVEYNRAKNEAQDNQIANLTSQLNQLLAQAPAGFLPRAYYGLTSGNQTYRFTANAQVNIALTAEDGTAFEIYSNNETDNNYIPAVAVKIDDSTVKIIIQGDYNYDSSSFNIVNMVTGASTSATLSGVLSLQNASSLANYPAVDNKEKQITVINNIETNSKNVIFASLDINSDGVYNWIEIGNFVDGVDGKSVRSVNGSNYSTIIAAAKVNDTLLVAEAFSTYDLGDLLNVDSLSPIALTKVGNIRGAQGETGATGQDGTDGTKVISDSGVPSNDLGVDGDTYIDTSTWNVYKKESGSWTSVGNIKGANGTNGTDGQNGQSFQMQSGLYSTPDNWGESGNVDGEGNALLQLPTLPQSSITGKGYVVYDPLTTPLAPFYDLYYANNGDLTWTIIHPFSGIAGQNGTDGQTPYISGGTWWIGTTNTGVAATGPQGAPGQGVPSGGTTGQVLAKIDSNDYNTEWITLNTKKYYIHNLKLYPTSYIRTCCTIITSDNTEFTYSTLAKWLYDNGYKNGVSNCYNVSLIDNYPDTKQLPIGLYSANGTQITLYTCNFSIVNSDISISMLGTTNYANGIAQVTDKVYEI